MPLEQTLVHNSSFLHRLRSMVIYSLFLLVHKLGSHYCLRQTSNEEPIPAPLFTLLGVSTLLWAAWNDLNFLFSSLVL